MIFPEVEDGRGPAGGRGDLGAKTVLQMIVQYTLQYCTRSAG